LKKLIVKNKTYAFYFANHDEFIFDYLHTH